MSTVEQRVGLVQLEGSAEEEFLRARYRTLIRRVPFLYAGLMGVTVGIAVAFFPTAPQILTLWMPLFFLIVGVNRMHFWRHVAPRHLRRNNLGLEFDRLSRVTYGLGIIYALWSIALSRYGDSQQISLLCFLLFVWTVNSTYTMSSAPVVSLFIIPMMTATISMLLISLGQPIYFVAAGLFTLSSFMIFNVIRQSYNNLAAMVASQQELEQQREQARDAERQAREIALLDPLTGLANRRRFEKEVSGLVDRRRVSGEPFSLLLIDLDGFKPVNDVYGHKAGDRVLKEVSRRLNEELGEGDLLARLGGDEFGVIVGSRLDADAVGTFADRLCERLRQPFSLEGSQMARLSGSCGIARFPVAGATAERLMLNADVALYESKNRSRGRVTRFSPHLDLDLALRRRSLIEQALRAAIVNEAFFLHFQPIVDIGDFSISSLEALARWKDPDLGDISPGEFIPLAEQVGLIDQISDILLRKAAAEAVTWPGQTLLSFNLSALQLVKPETGERILDTLEKVGLSPTRLEIEITETALMTDFDAALATIKVLRAAGVRTSLDDFGVGYASFSYLHKIAFDRVKIDSSFTAGILDDAKARQIVKAVVDLCSGLDMECVAEGIESRDQLAVLQQLDCQLGQGYYLVRPLQAARVMPLLRDGAALRTAIEAAREPGRARLTLAS